MRISRHQMFMGIARVVAQRSTCNRLNVGAVLVSGQNVVGIGYNGAPAGEQHCAVGGTVTCPHMGASGCTVDHAERNAFVRAGVRVDSAEAMIASTEQLAGTWDALYVTHSPCQRCAHLIHEMKVPTVYFEAEYRNAEPIKWLLSYGVTVHRLTPAGYLVDVATGKVFES